MNTTDPNEENRKRNEESPVRELRLRRRRSRTRWIYLVYQARNGRGRSALTPQECRHVQRRSELEVVVVG
jgi:hypothetical protein